MKLDGIYTPEELTDIIHYAQQLADKAKQMRSMLMYSATPECHAQALQDELQEHFAGLHHVALGLMDEDPTEAHRYPVVNIHIDVSPVEIQESLKKWQGRIFTSKDDGSIVPQWEGHRGFEDIGGTEQ